MSEFSATSEALLAGRSVRAALLITITFTDDSVVRLKTGMGDKVIGGDLYRGGLLIEIDGLDASPGTSAQTATFKLSGVDATIVAKAVDEADLCIGAEIVVALQMFGDGELAGEWQPVDDPVQLGTWEGDAPLFERVGPTIRSITLPGIGEWANRSRNPSAYYSDREQQRRVPGDRGGEFMAALTNKTRTWPSSNFV